MKVGTGVDETRAQTAAVGIAVVGVAIEFTAVGVAAQVDHAVAGCGGWAAAFALAISKKRINRAMV